MAEEAGEAAPQVADAPPAPVAVGVTVTPLAEAPPAGAVFRTLAVSVMAWPALTVAGGWAWKVSASPAAAWTVTAVEVELVTCWTSGTLASTQVAKPESVSGPGVAGAVHPVQVKTWVAAMPFTGRAGATAQDAAYSFDRPITLTAVVPLLASVRLMVNCCPTVSAGGVVEMLVAVTTGAATTWTAAEAGPATRDAPVLASTHVADPLRLSVCGVVGAVHPDQTRLTADPMAVTGMAGGVVQVIPLSDAPVTLAVESPLLARDKVTVNPCPALSGDEEAASPVAVTVAGDCTSAVALAVFDVTTRDPSFPSIPEADADRTTVPGVAEVQFRYWKTTGVPGRTVAETGEGAAQPAMAVGLTATAGAVPVLVTARLAVYGWPVLTVNGWPAGTGGVRASVRVAARAAGVSTVTEAAGWAVTARPEKASVPLTVNEKSTWPVERPEISAGA